MRAPGKLHYGWIIVAVTFVVLLVSAGIRAAPGVLIVPIEDEFHWSRALPISFGSYFEAFLLAGLLCFAALMALLIGVGRRDAEPARAAIAQ